MKLADLITPIDSMTSEELIERLRQVRHNREVVRPAARKHVERSEKKVSRRTVSKTESLLGALTDVEREALIQKLMQE